MTIQSNERNEAIIRKIKGLLAIAEDNKDDEESQSAFIMAQKLMMKHNISMGEVDHASKASQEVSDGKVTVYKKLFWWERRLASIISENFRVKFYYNNKVLDGETKAKRAIVFLGFKQDIELAREMYILAYDAITHYTDKFVNAWYEETGYKRYRETTTNLRNSYMRGFLHGINDKFEKQVAEMKQEYGLMILVPAEVEKKYEEMFGDEKGISYKIPPIEEIVAYQMGFNHGNKIDYTKSTIDS